MASYSSSWTFLSTNALRCLNGSRSTTVSTSAIASLNTALPSAASRPCSVDAAFTVSCARDRRCSPRKWFRERFVAIVNSHARTLASGGSARQERYARRNVSCVRSSASAARRVTRPR